MSVSQATKYNTAVFVQALKVEKAQCSTLYEAILHSIEKALPGYMMAVPYTEQLDDVSFFHAKLTHADGSLREDWEAICMEMPGPTLRVVK